MNWTNEVLEFDLTFRRGSAWLNSSRVSRFGPNAWRQWITCCPVLSDKTSLRRGGRFYSLVVWKNTPHLGTLRRILRPSAWLRCFMSGFRFSFVKANNVGLSRLGVKNTRNSPQSKRCSYWVSPIIESIDSGCASNPIRVLIRLAAPAIAILNFAAYVFVWAGRNPERVNVYASKILPFDKKIICAIMIL